MICHNKLDKLDNKLSLIHLQVHKNGIMKLSGLKIKLQLLKIILFKYKLVFHIKLNLKMLLKIWHNNKVNGNKLEEIVCNLIYLTLLLKLVILKLLTAIKILDIVLVIGKKLEEVVKVVLAHLEINGYKEIGKIKIWVILLILMTSTSIGIKSSKKLHRTLVSD